MRRSFRAQKCALQRHRSTNVVRLYSLAVAAVCFANRERGGYPPLHALPDLEIDG